MGAEVTRRSSGVEQSRAPRKRGEPRALDLTARTELVAFVDNCALSDHAFCLTRASVQISGFGDEDRRAAHDDRHEILQQREKGTHSRRSPGEG